MPIPGDEHVADEAGGLIAVSSVFPERVGASFVETLLQTVFAAVGFIAALNFIDIPASWAEPL